MLTKKAAWTTAVTDLINGSVTLVPVIWCLRQKPFSKRYRLWAAAFAFLAAVSFAGFFIHGFVMTDFLTDALWCGMYVFLSLMMSAYVRAVRYDTGGEEHFSRFSRISIGLALTVALLMCITVCVLSVDIFLLFSAYCMTGLIMCVIMLSRQMRSRPVFAWYIAAIFVLVAGSILQSIKSIRFRIIWEMNYDTVYHFTVLLFMLIQFRGVRLLKKEAQNG